MADNVNRLLIVEQDTAVVELVGKVAKEAGYAVASAASAATFVQLLDSFQPSLVIVDAKMPETDGVELLTALAARASTANVLLLGSADARIYAAAQELRASHGLAKRSMPGGVACLRPVSIGTIRLSRLTSR